MSTLREKRHHVRFAINDDPTHTCHWPGCTRQVKPAMFMCGSHWFKLPLNLRNEVWAAYRPGQEETKNPDRLYLETVRKVQNWITKSGLA
jgi:hypothetical protein